MQWHSCSSSFEEILLPSQDDVMKMLSDAWNSLDIDLEEAIKQNFVMVQNFYGSEHYKLCGKFYLLVFEKMNDFQRATKFALAKIIKRSSHDDHFTQRCM